MGSFLDAGTTVIARPSDAVVYYQNACRAASEGRIGFEWERHATDADGQPLPYRGQDGRPGTHDILTGMVRFGWKLVYEPGNPDPIALKRVIPEGDPNNPVDIEQLTLEPMGAVEYSSPACLRVGDLQRHLDKVNRELLTVCGDLGVFLLGVGYHPCSGFDPRITMPKKRYEIMARCVGPESLDAAVNTCSTQVSFDYRNQADFVATGRRLFQLGPVVMGLMNNANFRRGILMGPESVRMERWNTYADERGVRLGLVFDAGFGFERHAEAIFNTPVMLLAEGGGYKPAPEGMRFVDLADSGQATLTHYVAQLSTQSPIVRLRSNIELGVADSPRDPAMVIGTTAFLTALLYDARARREAGEIVGAWNEATCDQLRRQVPITGLATPLGDGPTLHSVASDLMGIAAGGLARRGEAVDLLAPLQDVLTHGALAVQARQMFGGRGEGPVSNRELVAFYATPASTSAGAVFHPRTSGQREALRV